MPLADRLAFQQAVIHSQGWIRDKQDHLVITVLVEMETPAVSNESLSAMLNQSKLRYSDQRPIRFEPLQSAN